MKKEKTNSTIKSSLLLEDFWGTLWLKKGNTFISAFCSRWWFKATIYCSSICTNPNGTIVSVHSDVTNTVNTWFRRNLRSDRKRRVFKKWHCCRPRSALFERATSFQDGKRAACSSWTGRTEHVFIWGKWFRWYIKHQSRVSFPLHFPGANPSKGRGSLYWAHMHTREQKQNKQRSFKYQPTCLLFDWRRYCTAILCSALWNTDIDETEAQLLNRKDRPCKDSKGKSD